MSELVDRVVEAVEAFREVGAEDPTSALREVDEMQAALGGHVAVKALAELAARLNAQELREGSDALPGSREASILCAGPDGEELEFGLDTTVTVRLGDRILFEEGLRDPQTVDILSSESVE